MARYTSHGIMIMIIVIIIIIIIIIIIQLMKITISETDRDLDVVERHGSASTADCGSRTGIFRNPLIRRAF